MIRLSELKDHLKIDADQTAEDPLLVDMEAAAVAYMENETGRYFGPVATFVEILSPRGYLPLWLEAIPITTDDYPDFLLERRSAISGEWGEVDDSEYEVEGQRLFPATSWTPAQRTLRASYTAGYAENAEPADVRGAVRQLTTRMYQMRLPTVTEVDDSVREVVRSHKITVV